MPRGDKSKHTTKQKRQAEHIEDGYEDRSVPKKDAERRAWATVNKIYGGGERGGPGRAKKSNLQPARTGGHKGRGSAATRSKAALSASAKKAAQTRKSRAPAAR